MARAKTQNPDDPPCPFNDMLIEMFGRTGDNGLWGKHMERTEVMETRLAKAEDRLAKIMLMSAAGAGLGGGVVSALMRLLG